VIALAATLLVAPGVASALNPVSFSSTGHMVEKRDYPGAARLPDGRVLVVGGYDGTNYLQTAEIYDPKTGTFSESGVGLMSTKRYAPATVTMPDGRVLVAGGYDMPNDVATAEVFNPSTAQFTPVGSMAEPREGAGGALLPDGRVLVAGGYDSTAGTDGEYIDSSEIFDPKTNTFSPGPKMGTKRYGAVTAPVSGDRILFAGGYSSDYLDTSEFFGSAGTFIAGPLLPQTRYAPTGASLPGGRALVAAGYDGSVNISSALIYDPKTNSFSSDGIGNMIGKREEAAAAELSDGRVLVLGGVDGGNELDTAEVLSVPSNSFKAKLKGRKVTFNVTTEGTGEATDSSTKLATTAKKKKKKPKLVKTTTRHGGPGKITVKVKLTKRGAAKLAQKGKLKVKVAFTPDGGLAAPKKLTLRSA
jgi:hypothetical protein